MKTVFILSLILLSTPFFLHAQPGTLDKSFGDTGVVLNTQFTGTANAMGLMSNGKIIQAGLAYDETTYMALTCYNTDGTADENFGTNGVVFYKPLAQALSIQIDTSDNIIVLSRTATDVALVKFKKDGGLDSSFGSNGTVITNVGQNDIPVNVVIQPDGKIVAGGYIINQPNESRQGFLIRYLPDGSLDKSFGNGGIVILGEVNVSSPFTGVYAIALQPNGQILMSAGFNGGVVYRFNADGSIDSRFGINGKAIFQQSDDVVKSFQANGLVVQPDGKIVGGGSGLKKQFSTDFTYMATARLNADGSIDSSFGNNGLQHVEFGQDASDGRSILLQKDGEVIVAGRALGKMAMAEFKVDGNIDSSFGDNGTVTTQAEGSGGCNNVLVQKDDKILLGGYTFVNNDDYFLLARYNNDTETKKQQIVTKIRHWLQHHNGFTWDANNSISSYVVQRSYDGIHFSSIARVNAGRQSNLTYQDPMPLSSTNYYRLQTTSINGAVTNSNVIAVTNDDIKISPNPATNSLHIEGLSSTQKTKLTVVDFAGNVKLQAVANNTSFNLNIASLTTGNYLLKIETKDEVVTKKFVKE